MALSTASPTCRSLQKATPRALQAAIRSYATSPYEPGASASKPLVELPKRYVPEQDSSSSYQRREESFGRQGLGRTGVATIVTAASVIGVYIGSIYARPSENWNEEPLPLPKPTPAGFEGVLMSLKKLGLAEKDISSDVDDLYQHAATVWSSAYRPLLHES